MKVEGSCHCGQITFKAEIEPGSVRICHCTDCQMLSGSAFRVNAPTPATSFRLLSGAPKIYIKTAESGKKRAQAFCANCGTQIYASDPHEPQSYSLRVGTLKQRGELGPVQQIWYRSSLPWIGEIQVIPHLERQ
jgi:hypothetical protein